jgi:antitoxin component HigA of HigAB toxin-antitoxin module
MSKIAPATLLLASLWAPLAQADALQEVQALIQQGQYTQALERAQQLQQNPPSEAQLRALRDSLKANPAQAQEAARQARQYLQEHPEALELYRSRASAAGLDR